MTHVLTKQGRFLSYRRVVCDLFRTTTSLRKCCTVTVEQGELKGKLDFDIYGTPFLSFMGIPYAKPPLGKLRLKPTEPPERWVGVRDATKQGERCYSMPLILKKITLQNLYQLLKKGSEDCLFLNIFTRQVWENEHSELKPVMVYIHGGAFILGSSTRSIHGPEFLMTEDIVLVTINYRLGALGFLAIDDPSLGATGNAALKDQVQALKWVQRNIKQFSGDPNNVTIFGQSAGAACVHYLVLSPMAKGLFHKAIIQSGSALGHWGRGDNDAKKFVKNLGYSETDSETVLEILQKVSVKKIYKVQTKMTTMISPSQKSAFGPTVEPQTANAFLYEEPLDLLCSGVYNHVPLMLGYTTGEGIFIAHSKVFGMTPNLEDFVPYYFGYEKNSKEYEEINKKIKLFYLGTEKPDQNKLELFYDLFTDTVYLKPIHFAVKAHAKVGHKPVYYYRVSLNTHKNLLEKLFKIKTEKVIHGADVFYLFKVGDFVLKPGTIEEISVLRFVKMWTNFARTGNPIPEKTCLLDVVWEPVNEDTMHFLDIGCELVPGVDPDMDRMQFWEELSEGIKPCY